MIYMLQHYVWASLPGCRREDETLVKLFGLNVDLPYEQWVEGGRVRRQKCRVACLFYCVTPIDYRSS
jgi:hypothetical protein